MLNANQTWKTIALMPWHPNKNQCEAVGKHLYGLLSSTDDNRHNNGMIHLFYAPGQGLMPMDSMRAV